MEWGAEGAYDRDLGWAARLGTALRDVSPHPSFDKGILNGI